MDISTIYRNSRPESELPAQETAAARGRAHRRQQVRGHAAAVRVLPAQCGADQRAHQHLEHHQRAHRVARQQERRHLVRAEPAEALHRTGVHRDPRDVQLAEVGQRRAHLRPDRAAEATADHHDLGQQQPALDDLAQPARLHADDADAGHLRPGVARGRGQRVGEVVRTGRLHLGDLGEALGVLASSPIEGLAVDLVAGSSTVDDLSGVRGLRDKTLVAGLVDGRNVWRTDLDAALSTGATLLGMAAEVAVSTSCSLLHVPYDVEAETDLDPQVKSWLAFARQKLREVVVLDRALHEGRAAVADELAESRRAVTDRATAARVRDDRVRSRADALRPADARRSDYAERVAAQRESLQLPPLPTTTIGSFPQTTDVRKARAALRSGNIDRASYKQRMRDEIERVVRLQEDLGLDVLVHGEPERNDMVQYFAEYLEGFASTRHGWVQSYGSRCVRPPILFGDVSRPAPMTVEWSRYAQQLTGRPVKGMLTGPVTVLAWSFVRDDQPLADTARQVALAIRDEVHDLESAGIRVVQVDEPALRELLPLRAAEHAAYLDWAVESFRLATSGVADSTQIHTHLCYSEFGDVIDAIVALDADVTSIEAARSRMEVLDDLNAVGFGRGVLGARPLGLLPALVPQRDRLSGLTLGVAEHAGVDVEDLGGGLQGVADVVPLGRGVLEG